MDSAAGNQLTEKCKIFFITFILKLKSHFVNTCDKHMLGYYTLLVVYPS